MDVGDQDGQVTAALLGYSLTQGKGLATPRPEHRFAGLKRGDRWCLCVLSIHLMTPLHPKTLLMSKWTAVQPVSENKHFLVSRVIPPETRDEKVEGIEMEAVFSKKGTRIHWRQLQDETLWRRGCLTAETPSANVTSDRSRDAEPC